MLKWHKQSTAPVFRCALAAPVMIPLFEPLMIMFIDQERSFAAAAAAMFRNSWPSLLGIFVLSARLATTLTTDKFRSGSRYAMVGEWVEYAARAWCYSSSSAVL